MPNKVADHEHLCCNCKHFRWVDEVCARRPFQINAVTGVHRYRAAGYARQDREDCGIEAKHFEPRPASIFDHLATLFKWGGT